MKKVLVLCVLGLLFLVACIPEIEPEEKVPEGRLVTSYNQLPITNWDDAWTLAIDKFESKEIWECNRSDMERRPFKEWTGSFPKDKHNYYGHRATTCRQPTFTRASNFECNDGDYYDYSDEEVTVVYFDDDRCKDVETTEACESMIVGYNVFFECMVIKEWDYFGNCTATSECGAWQQCYNGTCRRNKMAHIGLDFEFDPNNGFISTLICNNKEFPNCPKDENGTYIRIYEWGKNPDKAKYMNLTI
jgi:hypothetical protein